MRRTLRKYLILPKLISLSRSAPKNRNAAWDGYWEKIGGAGAPGGVLWDAGTDHEFMGYREILERHFAPDLPVLDVGCGHGRFSRALAAAFPQVIGVDVSAHAVARAREESADMDNLSYLVHDMTLPGAGSELAHPAGANVFVRGVLHVLGPAEQAALMENLGQLVGVRGRVFLAETNFQGNAVEYVAHLGASPRNIPAPLELAIRNLPMPGRFGPAELARAAPADRWAVLEDGPAAIETNPIMDITGDSLVPGYYAVVRRRQ